MASPKKKTKTRRREKKNVVHGVAHIKSTFNNTIISISDMDGNVLSWASAGNVGFKGSRKSTPFAAQLAAEAASRKAQEHGVRRVDVARPTPTTEWADPVLSLGAFAMPSRAQQPARDSAEIVGTGQPAIALATTSALNAQRSSNEPPPRTSNRSIIRRRAWGATPRGAWRADRNRSWPG